MPVYRLTDQLYIAPQLQEEDIAAAAALGIRSVICNRPDAEEAGQPAFADIQQLLARHGIGHSRHQPTTAPAITPADAAAFQALLDELPAPVLAYCRTGTRSTLLWAISQAAAGQHPDDLIEQARQVHVDLQPFAARLHAAQAV